MSKSQVFQIMWKLEAKHRDIRLQRVTQLITLAFDCHFQCLNGWPTRYSPQLCFHRQINLQPNDITQHQNNWTAGSVDHKKLFMLGSQVMVTQSLSTECTLTRLGFKTCFSKTKTKTKTKTCLSKTKTKTKTLRFQDQDQDSEDQDQDQDSAVSRTRPRPRPRPRPRLWCPRPRPRLKTYKTNTGSPWLGWTVTNRKTEKSWQAENSAYW